MPTEAAAIWRLKRFCKGAQSHGYQVDAGHCQKPSGLLHMVLSTGILCISMTQQLTTKMGHLRNQNTATNVFYDLWLEVRHDFCHTIMVTQTSSEFLWEKTMWVKRCPEAGIIEGPLEPGYHTILLSYKYTVLDLFFLLESSFIRFVRKKIAPHFYIINYASCFFKLGLLNFFI